MQYTVVIEKAPDNYAAYVPDLSGCVATAQNAGRDSDGDLRGGPTISRHCRRGGGGGSIGVLG